MRKLQPQGVLIILLALAACSKPGPTEQERIKTFNEAGWALFEENDFSGALIQFAAVLSLDPDNVEGNVGRGWSLLMQGNPSVSAATAALEVGSSDADWRLDAWCGLSAAALNELRYPQADSLAARVLSIDSSYVFVHRTVIDWRDLLIIQAQARFYAAAYVQAWQALLPITPGTEYENIDPADPATWFIGTQSYTLFEELLARVISALAEQHR